MRNLGERRNIHSARSSLHDSDLSRVNSQNSEVTLGCKALYNAMDPLLVDKQGKATASFNRQKALEDIPQI